MTRTPAPEASMKKEAATVTEEPIPTCPMCGSEFPFVRDGIVQNGEAMRYQIHLLEHLVEAMKPPSETEIKEFRQYLATQREMNAYKPTPEPDTDQRLGLWPREQV